MTATTGLLVFGDVMLDRNVIGRVERISPEAPVPAVAVERETIHLGGAGNVAHNVRTLGHPVTLVGVRGDDEAGAQLLSLAHERQIDARLLIDPTRPTTTKSRVFGGRAQQVLRLDRESTEPLAPALERQARRLLAEVLPQVRCVIVSDYAKGAATPRLLRWLLRRAAELQLPTIVDPKKRDFSAYRGAWILTPNLSEAAAALGGPIGGGDEAAAMAATRLRIRSSDAHNILLMRGEHGMTLCTPAETTHLRTAAREVSDVTGAGDTVVAMLAVALAEGCPLREATARANLAAGIAVSKAGTQPVERAEVERLLGRQGTEHKILTAAEARDCALRWKKAGRRVVFTNGCFDLLHAGHVHCLEEARRQGDCLVVALNSDVSLRGLKGNDRPLVPQRYRARLIAALECVDVVVLFDEPHPAALVELLRPDVLVKGGDYRPEEIAGAERVQQDGGRVVIVPLYEGLSTTQLLEAAARGATSSDSYTRNRQPGVSAT